MYKISLSEKVIADMVFFGTSEPKILLKIVQPFDSVMKTPFTGIGEPEALKHKLKGFWSRGIDREHRLVYHVKDETVFITQCRFHY